MSYLLSLATANPTHLLTQVQAGVLLESWLAEDVGLLAKAKSIFNHAGVRQRFSALPPEELLFSRTFEERNRCYLAASRALSVELISNALRQADVTPKAIDFLVVTSCTGYALPSLDCHLINALGMRSDIRRLPLLQLGCSGGAQALALANTLLKASPASLAVVAAIEYPTLTFISEDRSLANVVSAAIFGDGGACAILAGESAGRTGRMRIAGSGSHVFPETMHLMGFDLTQLGFKMVLDRDIPEIIGSSAGAPLKSFMAERNLQPDFAAIHPGGQAILRMLQSMVGLPQRFLAPAQAVLEQFGNMSSATVMFVLERLIAAGVQGDGLAAAFGPGFSLELLHLQASESGSYGS